MTIHHEAVLAATPQQVYEVLTTGAAFAKATGDRPATIGAGEGATFELFGGPIHGRQIELVPGERLRYSDRFEDPNLPGEMITTVAIKPVSCGVDLNVVQEGVPEMIPAEMCYLGWQDSLMLLAKLVEAEIPD